jgi:hypothetical protein
MNKQFPLNKEQGYTSGYSHFLADFFKKKNYFLVDCCDKTSFELGWTDNMPSK